MILLYHLKPNDHEGKGDDHDASVGELQLQLVGVVPGRDDPVDQGTWARLIVGRQSAIISKLTIAVEKDERQGHEDGVPVERDAHVLNITHSTLEMVESARPMTMVTTVQWFDRIFQLTLMLIAQWTVRITAEIPNASTTSKQRKKRRLVWNQLLNLDPVGVVEPVVDGELHDGVTIEAGPEDLLLPPPHLLLCLLCGQLVVENLDVGKLWISEISLTGFLFSTFYIFLLSLKIPSLPVKLLIWQAVQFKELLR